MNYKNIKFLESCDDVDKLPIDKGNEIAIIGCSNVGKSSFLNFIANDKKLSFISKSPGRTKNINFFLFQDEIRLVDFPGYGYSKTSKVINFKFNNLIYKYIKNRKCLKCIFLIMDIRYPLKKNDINIIEFIHNQTNNYMFY